MWEDGASPGGGYSPSSPCQCLCKSIISRGLIFRFIRLDDLSFVKCNARDLHTDTYRLDGGELPNPDCLQYFRMPWIRVLLLRSGSRLRRAPAIACWSLTFGTSGLPVLDWLWSCLVRAGRTLRAKGRTPGWSNS